VQALFDAADGRVAAIRGTSRKGAVTARRDAALLKRGGPPKRRTVLLVSEMDWLVPVKVAALDQQLDRQLVQSEGGWRLHPHRESR
jgi:hypothetical protein